MKPKPAMSNIFNGLNASSKKAIGQILRFIKSHNNFLVSAHVRSDGDALGSQIALNTMLRRMGKNSHAVCDGGVSVEYRFLPGADRVGNSPKDLKKGYDAVFTVDSGNFERLERIGDALPRDIFKINIDHHASNDRFGDINWIEPKFSSTGEMVYELIKASGVRVDRDMATNVYVALVTDTGRFSFSNTSVASHSRAAELLSYGVEPSDITNKLWRNKKLNQLKLLAECINNIKTAERGKIAWVTLTRKMTKRHGFVPCETQEYIDIIKSLKSVAIAILFRETRESNKVKISFRTDKGIDGVKLAAKFGGGGHPRASGATINSNIEYAEMTVVKWAKRFIRNGCR